MQQLMAALAFVALFCAGSAAQSLSPMRVAGDTPSDAKGFRLTVGNPYKQRMVFVVTAMDPGFTHAVPDAAVSVSELRLAPGASRPIIVTFKIDPAIKERTIGVCVQPREIDGPILPRVCGTYTGRMRGVRG